MALENLISVEFTNAELTKLNDAISIIESVLLNEEIVIPRRGKLLIEK